MGRISFISLGLSFISLMIFWLIMSGLYDLIHISYGIISVISVLAINYKIKSYHFFDDEMDDLLHVRFLKVVTYIPWLLIQILKSGFHVALIILTPGKKILPSIVEFKADLPSAHAKMILGNSITLTPGTLTIDIMDDKFIVHAISDKSFEGIVNDEMPKKVLGLFEKSDRKIVTNVIVTKK